MPACYIHEQVALTAIQKADIEISDALAPILLLGSQGPDTLFCYRAVKTLGRIQPFGRMMHTSKTGDFLCALGKLAISDRRLQLFVLGFVTHYATDTTIHPYVYGHSIEHIELEKRMDRALFRANGGNGIPRYNEFMKPSEPHWPIIARAWGRAAEDVYPGSGLNEAVVQTAIQDTARMTPFMHSYHGRKHRFAQMIDTRILGKPGILSGHVIVDGNESEDVLNMANQPWKSPYEPDRTRTESVPELMAGAIASAGQWMREMGACWRSDDGWEKLRDSLGQKNYLTGLPCEEP